MIDAARAVGALILAGFLITSCNGAGSPGSSPTSSSAVTTTPSPPTASLSSTPGRFTSAIYGYSLRLPASWTSTQASSKWDGLAGLDIDAPQVDKFHSDSTAVLWAVATPWKQDLAAWTRHAIDFTNQFHGDSCPAEPATTASIAIGGQPGELLAYDCGVLINQAATVHNGVGYWFVLKDDSVQAANDPVDHEKLLKILQSVHFPD